MQIIYFSELIDITIEDYFDVLEGIGERMDKVEDKLLLEPTKETLSEIYALACWIFIFPVLVTRLTDRNMGFWIISIIVTGFMIRFFKKKKWL